MLKNPNYELAILGLELRVVFAPAIVSSITHGIEKIGLCVIVALLSHDNFNAAKFEPTFALLPQGKSYVLTAF